MIINSSNLIQLVLYRSLFWSSEMDNRRCSFLARRNCPKGMENLRTKLRHQELFYQEDVFFLFLD